MKNIRIALLLIVICVQAMGCHTAEKRIAGPYATQTKNEYFQTVDTLIIRELNTKSRIYSVSLHIWYRRINNGNNQRQKYMEQSWTGIYEPDQSLLSDPADRKSIWFSHDDTGFRSSKAFYHKIN